MLRYPQQYLAICPNGGGLMKGGKEQKRNNTPTLAPIQMLQTYIDLRFRDIMSFLQ